MFSLGRVVLVLPVVSQPRLAAGDWSWVVGGDLCCRSRFHTSPPPFYSPGRGGIATKLPGFSSIASLISGCAWKNVASSGCFLRVAGIVNQRRLVGQSRRDFRMFF